MIDLTFQMQEAFILRPFSKIFTYYRLDMALLLNSFLMEGVLCELNNY